MSEVTAMIGGVWGKRNTRTLNVKSSEIENTFHVDSYVTILEGLWFSDQIEMRRRVLPSLCERKAAEQVEDQGLKTPDRNC